MSSSSSSSSSSSPSVAYRLAVTSSVPFSFSCFPLLIDLLAHFPLANQTTNSPEAAASSSAPRLSPNSLSFSRSFTRLAFSPFLSSDSSSSSAACRFPLQTLLHSLSGPDSHSILNVNTPSPPDILDYTLDSYSDTFEPILVEWIDYEFSSSPPLSFLFAFNGTNHIKFYSHTGTPLFTHQLLFPSSATYYSPNHSHSHSHSSFPRFLCHRSSSHSSHSSLASPFPPFFASAASSTNSFPLPNTYTSLYFLFSPNLLIEIDGKSLYFLLQHTLSHSSTAFPVDYPSNSNSYPNTQQQRKSPLETRYWQLGNSNTPDSPLPGEISDFYPLKSYCPFGSGKMEDFLHCSADIQQSPVQILTVGANPYFAIWELKESSSADSALSSTSSLAVKVASKVKSAVKSAVFNYAKSFFSSSSASQSNQDDDDTDSSPTSSGPITVNTGNQLTELSEQNRFSTILSVDPSDSYAAIADSFGRIILVELFSGLGVKMWKGYRDVQIVWGKGAVKEDPTGQSANSPANAAAASAAAAKKIERKAPINRKGKGKLVVSELIDDEVSSNSADSAASSSSSSPAVDSSQDPLLYFYLPRRGLLECWSFPFAKRLTAISIGYGWKMLNYHNLLLFSPNSTHSEWKFAQLKAFRPISEEESKRIHAKSPEEVRREEFLSQFNQLKGDWDKGVELIRHWLQTEAEAESASASEDREREIKKFLLDWANQAAEVHYQVFDELPSKMRLLKAVLFAAEVFLAVFAGKNGCFHLPHGLPSAAAFSSSAGQKSVHFSESPKAASARSRTSLLSAGAQPRPALPSALPLHYFNSSADSNSFPSLGLQPSPNTPEALLKLHRLASFLPLILLRLLEFRNFHSTYGEKAEEGSNNGENPSKSTNVLEIARLLDDGREEITRISWDTIESEENPLNAEELALETIGIPLDKEEFSYLFHYSSIYSYFHSVSHLVAAYSAGLQLYSKGFQSSAAECWKVNDIAAMSNDLPAFQGSLQAFLSNFYWQTGESSPVGPVSSLQSLDSAHLLTIPVYSGDFTLSSAHSSPLTPILSQFTPFDSSSASPSQFPFRLHFPPFYRLLTHLKRAKLPYTHQFTLVFDHYTAISMDLLQKWLDFFVSRGKSKFPSQSLNPLELKFMQSFPAIPQWNLLSFLFLFRSMAQFSLPALFTELESLVSRCSRFPQTISLIFLLKSALKHPFTSLIPLLKPFSLDSSASANDSSSDFLGISMVSRLLNPLALFAWGSSSVEAEKPVEIPLQPQEQAILDHFESQFFSESQELESLLHSPPFSLDFPLSLPPPLLTRWRTLTRHYYQLFFLRSQLPETEIAPESLTLYHLTHEKPYSNLIAQQIMASEARFKWKNRGKPLESGHIKEKLDNFILFADYTRSPAWKSPISPLFSLSTLGFDDSTANATQENLLDFKFTCDSASVSLYAALNALEIYFHNQKSHETRRNNTFWLHQACLCLEACPISSISGGLALFLWNSAILPVLQWLFQRIQAENDENARTAADSTDSKSSSSSESTASKRSVSVVDPKKQSSLLIPTFFRLFRVDSMEFPYFDPSIDQFRVFFGVCDRFYTYFERILTEDEAEYEGEGESFLCPAVLAMEPVEVQREKKEIDEKVYQMAKQYAASLCTGRFHSHPPYFSRLPSVPFSDLSSALYSTLNSAFHALYLSADSAAATGGDSSSSLLSPQFVPTQRKFLHYLRSTAELDLPIANFRSFRCAPKDLFANSFDFTSFQAVLKVIQPHSHDFKGLNAAFLERWASEWESAMKSGHSTPVPTPNQPKPGKYTRKTAKSRVKLIVTPPSHSPTHVSEWNFAYFLLQSRPPSQSFPILLSFIDFYRFPVHFRESLFREALLSMAERGEDSRSYEITTNCIDLPCIDSIYLRIATLRIGIFLQQAKKTAPERYSQLVSLIPANLWEWLAKSKPPAIFLAYPSELALEHRENREFIKDSGSSASSLSSSASLSSSSSSSTVESKGFPLHFYVSNQSEPYLLYSAANFQPFQPLYAIFTRPITIKQKASEIDLNSTRFLLKKAKNGFMQEKERVSSLIKKWLQERMSGGIGAGGILDDRDMRFYHLHYSLDYCVKLMEILAVIGEKKGDKE